MDILIQRACYSDPLKMRARCIQSYATLSIEVMAAPRPRLPFLFGEGDRATGGIESAEPYVSAHLLR